ncbi:MAG: hypothetical protein JST00_40455 [Deltaproteobacteria bacterium]|nr:hypothetical protein [Deltaproteobacteria bacterium]
MTTPALRRARVDTILIATMHGKQVVAADVIREVLGMSSRLAGGLDTDAFGTFTGEIPRTRSPLATAVAKAEAGLAGSPWAELALASEGSYGPHPAAPWLARGVEEAVLVSRERGLLACGRHVTSETNYGVSFARSVDDGLEQARRYGIPEHGVIVSAAAAGRPLHHVRCVKGLTRPEEITTVLDGMLRAFGEVAVESDMRAHLNPTRMKAIGVAVRRACEALLDVCPRCTEGGLSESEPVVGAPCETCGLETSWPKADIFLCHACGYGEQRPRAGAVSPRFCGVCNP